MTALQSSPAPDGREQDFGIVARTTVDLAAGRYRFQLTSDDGARLYVDGNRQIDAWTIHGPQRDVVDLSLSAGHHELKIEYFQNGGSYILWTRIAPLDSANR